MLVEIVRPYTRIKLDFLASELGIDVHPRISPQTTLMLTCRGKIDQIGRVLVLEGKGAGREGEMKEFYGAVGKWASSSRNLFRSVAKV